MKISYSKLNSFLMCGEAFRRKYINGEVSKVGFAAIRGRAIHKAIEIANKNKMQNKPVDLDNLQLIGLSEFDRNKNDAYLPPETTAIDIKTNIESKRIITEGIRLFYDEIRPQIDPLGVEQFLSYNFDGITLLGYFDCIGENNTIWDFKTSTKSPPKDQEPSLQGIIYALIYEALNGVLPKFKKCHLVILKKSSKVVIVDEEITLKKKGMVLEYCKNLNQSMAANVFAPADPNGWLCTQKWCSFYDDCRFKNNIEE